MDADACPRVIRDILVRAAQRVEVPLNFVANHALGVPQSQWVRSIQVEKGFDVADNYIAQHVAKDDLVITSDIPLAAEVIEEGAHVITSRGEKFTKNNVRQRLNMRDFSDAYMDDYIMRNWDNVRHCVGGYMLEAEGVRLFEKIDGDYFSVLGMPLVEILSYLTLNGELPQ